MTKPKKPKKPTLSERIAHLEEGLTEAYRILNFHHSLFHRAAEEMRDKDLQERGIVAAEQAEQEAAGEQVMEDNKEVLQKLSDGE